VNAPNRHNIGHGHVWKRADGAVARCGGPKLCAECARDERLLAFEKGSEDLVHSDMFVTMFLGFLAVKGLVTPGTTPPQLLESWLQFKTEMGKNPDGTMAVKWA
jgi:hypothetical protein